jgi:CheY-like chemotaxis protein
MPAGGKLTIQTADVEILPHAALPHPYIPPGHYVMLAVADTGVGMDSETQARAFEPFFTTKEKGKGTGLGLATVFGIVKQSGGHIWVESQPGRGTTFTVYFPKVIGEPGPPSTSRAPPETNRGNETILLVEDDDQLRTVTRGILSRLGYQVLEAPAGPEALRLCEQHEGKIHVLLTDVVMPKMSGPQLAERIVAARPDIRPLFISGYTDEAIVHHGVLEPGVSFLQKPITPDTLARKIREVLGARPATRTGGAAGER